MKKKFRNTACFKKLRDTSEESQLKSKNKQLDTTEFIKYIENVFLQLEKDILAKRRKKNSYDSKVIKTKERDELYEKEN